MIVESLTVHRFMLYEDAEVRPPRPGLTLVSGSNGSGKSALVEAVVWALYGETVRGASPVNGGPCEVTLVVSQEGSTYVVTRERDGRATQLQFTCDGRDLAGQTTTDTQERVDAVFGNFERFCSTRIFSPEFMARFALATDKERKGLLEGILGLGQFDRALALLRTDLTKAKAVLTEARVAEARARGALEALEAEPDPDVPTAARVAKLVASKVEAELTATALGASAEEIRKVHDTALVQFRALERQRSQAIGEGSAIRDRLRPAKASAHLARDLDSCPVCLRPVGPGDRETISRHYGEQMAADDAALAINDQRVGELALAEEDARGEGKELEAMWRRAESAARRAEVDLTARANALREAREAQARAALAEDRLGKARQAAAASAGAVLAAGEGVASLEAAEDVLGLRGARVLLLDRALGQLQGRANEALAIMGVPYRVEISGRTTLRTGREVDAVSVGLTGAGGGEYRGASRGQRTRVDVALLLGLAALRGGEGILFFDEVMDSLDTEGLEAVAAYLGVMARDRQVVIISHQPDLASRLAGAQHIRVAIQGGKSTLTT